MKKPFVVIDSEKIRITDLQNGTSEIWDKTENRKEIYSNSDIYASLLSLKTKETPIRQITTYKHKNH
jgi:hypothetical protein